MASDPSKDILFRSMLPHFTLSCSRLNINGTLSVRPFCYISGQRSLLLGEIIRRSGARSTRTLWLVRTSDFAMTATLTQSFPAVSLKDMAANKIADYTSYDDIGREMFPPREARDGNQCRGAINQPVHPRPWVFMSNNARHGPREQRVPGRKRAVERVITPEESVAVALIWPLPPREELHADVERH
jgi:hypothetical protein